jgi:hypothetical protein
MLRAQAPLPKSTVTMSRVKSLLLAVTRWGWFALLALIAFGYLASGLSQRQPQNQAIVSNDGISSTVNVINQHRSDVLDVDGLDSAPMADWMTVCRRLSLALVGNQLSLEEIRELVQLPEFDREATHLTNLLGDSRFHHYWAERWTRFLVGTDEGEFIVFRRRRFRVWLAEVFAENRPYDQLVRDLVTAEGLWTDEPEVNFLTATFDSNGGQPDPIRLAARTSRAFLGLRIDCLQCHSDFLGNVSLGDIDDPREGLQSDFHQLAAFFTSAKTSGLQGVQSGDVDYQYKYLNAEQEVTVEPAVPYSPELLSPAGNARERLADWITHPENKQAARAAVSHVWALLFGRPSGEAVDNLPLDQETSPILSALADDFVEHGFNVRRLIRLIAGSEAFRADSRADFPITEAHEQSHAVFPLVRLRPEQVAGSVIQASRIKRTDRESSFLLQLITLIGNNEFVQQYGDVGEDEFTTDAVTVTQRLLMMNGKMTREMVEPNPVLNASAHIGMFSKDNPHTVETIYLCALNRYPTEAETKHFARRLDEAKDPGKAREDIVWILMNSSELAWNH